MSGAGIEVTVDAQYQRILDALAKAGSADMKELADFAGAELHKISIEAFTAEEDPVTGKKWKKLKRPRQDGSERPILQDGGQLRRSLNWQAFGDGSVLFGSNMVYARIHQEGGRAGRGRKTPIQARPYMGVPKGFDRKILNDPAVLSLLGLER